MVKKSGMQENLTWLSEKEGRVIFRREGWYRVSVEYDGESSMLQEFCLETTKPEEPEADAGSYMQGKWTNRPAAYKFVSGKLFFQDDPALNTWNQNRESGKQLRETVLRLQTNGMHRYKVRAVSKAGNRSAAANVFVKFWDKQPGKPKVNCPGSAENGEWHEKEVRRICAEKRKKKGPRLQEPLSQQRIWIRGGKKLLKKTVFCFLKKGNTRSEWFRRMRQEISQSQEWKKNIYIDGSKPRISLEGKTVNRYEKDGCKLTGRP